MAIVQSSSPALLCQQGAQLPGFLREGEVLILQAALSRSFPRSEGGPRGSPEISPRA